MTKLGAVLSVSQLALRDGGAKTLFAPKLQCYALLRRVCEVDNNHDQS